MRQMRVNHSGRYTVTLSVSVTPERGNPDFIGYIVEVRNNTFLSADPRGFVARRRFDARLHGLAEAFASASDAFDEEVRFRRIIAA